MTATVAALYVDPSGIYAIDGVDCWGIDRDARNYRGPYPVVAHPPCQRWGRFALGGPLGKIRYKIGEDGGCFAAALTAVRDHGGVLEHPAHSKAWHFFGLRRPNRRGWLEADQYGGMTCEV